MIRSNSRRLLQKNAAIFDADLLFNVGIKSPGYIVCFALCFAVKGLTAGLNPFYLQLSQINAKRLLSL